jgi:hypothetical protein
MAAGTQIKATGNPIFYAGYGISNGFTNGLLDVFTDVSGATPSGGAARMAPDVVTAITANEPTYRVSTGTYGGSYFINRNNRQGEIFYNNYASTGQFDIDLLHSYIHWTTDQRLSIDVQNVTGKFYFFGVKIGANSLIDSTPFSPGPFGSGLDLYANLSGSVGAYTPGAINTGWTFTIAVEYDSANPPGDFIVDVGVFDFHTGDHISINSIPLSIGGRFPPSYQYDVYIDYWRCANIIVNIHP